MYGEMNMTFSRYLAVGYGVLTLLLIKEKVKNTRMS